MLLSQVAYLPLMELTVFLCRSAIAKLNLSQGTQDGYLMVIEIVFSTFTIFPNILSSTPVNFGILC